MENYPKSDEHEVAETQYSEAFYRLVNQLENLKNKAEDPNLPEEERKKAQAAFEEWTVKLEKDFEELDAKDKEEQERRLGSQSMAASATDAEFPVGQVSEQEAADEQRFVDSQGFSHNTPEESIESEPKTWQRTA